VKTLTFVEESGFPVFRFFPSDAKEASYSALRASKDRMEGRQFTGGKKKVVDWEILVYNAKRQKKALTAWKFLVTNA
jgi:hypothetical protein